MKYKIWLDEWFKNYIQPSSKKKTCERYSEIIEKHLKVKLGEYELDELTPLALQRYVTELLKGGNIVTGKGLSANSVNGIITVIQNSLKLAYMLGEVKEYTADKIKRPKAKEKKVSCFTISEQKRIERAVLSGKKPKLFGIVFVYTQDSASGKCWLWNGRISIFKEVRSRSVKPATTGGAIMGNCVVSPIRRKQRRRRGRYRCQNNFCRF